MKKLESGKVEFSREEWKAYIALPSSERLVMNRHSRKITTEAQVEKELGRPNYLLLFPFETDEVWSDKIYITKDGKEIVIKDT